MGLCSCIFWLQRHLLVLSATIFQEDVISTFLEDRYDASYQGKELRVLLAYKRFGMHKVTAPQLWNKPTICATSHWVSSAPHPWDRVSEEKDVSMSRGMGGVDEAFLVCFYCCFISTHWFILKKRKRKEEKGRERKGKKRMKTYLKYKTLNSTTVPCYPRGTGPRTHADIKICGCSSPLHTDKFQLVLSSTWGSCTHQGWITVFLTMLPFHGALR